MYLAINCKHVQAIHDGGGYVGYVWGRALMTYTYVMTDYIVLYSYNLNYTNNYIVLLKYTRSILRSMNVSNHS